MLTHRLMQSCEIRRDYPLYGKMKTRSNLIHGVATGKVKFSIFAMYSTHVRTFWRRATKFGTITHRQDGNFWHCI